MANPDRTGFRPLRTRCGSCVTLQRRQALNANTLAIFWGDLVENDGTGMWYPESATNASTGSVSQGASYLNAASERVLDKYLPASTTGSATAEAEAANYIFIVEDVDEAIFENQIDEAITMTGIGLNYAVVLGAGSTTTGISAHEIDATAPGTTATLTIAVDGWVIRPDNDITLADVKVECHINASNYGISIGRTGT